MVDRMERAVSSYEQLGGADESFDDLCKKVQQQQDNLLDLLKKLHTSTLSVQITQKNSENTAIKNILEAYSCRNRNRGKTSRASQPEEKYLTR